MDNVQEAERPRFTVIHHAVMLSLAISANEYLILDTVYHLSAKHGYCYKSIRAMGRDLGITAMGVSKMVTRLLDRGLLERSAAGLVCGRTYVSVAYVETIPSVNKVVIRKQSLRASVNKVDKSVNLVDECKQSTSKKNSIELQENNNTLVQQDVARPGNLTQALQDVIKALGKDVKRVAATDGRKLKLKTRSKKMGYQTVLKAARNLAADSYMTGDNDSGKDYATIDYLLRSDENIDKWANIDESARIDINAEVIL